MRYRVEEEENSMNCGFDFESFLWGRDCPEKATKVIIEGADFHFAHLCDEHTEYTMNRLADEHDPTS